MAQSEKTYTLLSRRCNRCGETKPLTEFPVNRTETLGRGYFCSNCHYKATTAHRAKNREHYTKLERDRYHRMQEEASCHMKPRDFYHGFLLIRALENAEVVQT